MIRVGCCYAGLINTVEQIKRVTGEMSIYAVIGGLHLKIVLKVRIEAIVKALFRLPRSLPLRGKPAD